MTAYISCKSCSNQPNGSRVQFLLPSLCDVDIFICKFKPSFGDEALLACMISLFSLNAITEKPKIKRGSSVAILVSSVVRHLPLLLEVPGSIPARGEENFNVRTRFL